MKGQPMFQTYLNSPDLKARFLDEIGKHEEADAFIKGSYKTITKKEFRGCAIGCSLHSMNIINGALDPTEATGDHTRYENELGLPTWLAYLEDHIFESLPLDLAKTWPRRFAEAVPVGAIVDDIVLAKILRWCLADAEFGVRFATDNEEIRGYIDAIVVLFDAEIEGPATGEQRESAARAAWEVRAAWEAREASEAWAARAAWVAREARAARAAWEVRAAREAWAAWAAREAWAAWEARLDPEGKKADAFFPSLSEFVLSVLRDLPPAPAAGTSSEARA